MIVFQQLWHAVLDHVVLLLVALPTVGAILVRSVGLRSPAGAQAIAYSNSWATLLLMAIIVSQYRPADRGLAEPWQMTSAVTWVNLSMDLPSTLANTDQPSDSAKTSNVSHEPFATRRQQPNRQSARNTQLGIRIAVGMDGLALPFAALIVAVGFAAVRGISNHEPRAMERLGDVLFSQSALLAVLTATDAVWLSACLLWSTSCVYVLLARWGALDRRAAALKFLRYQLLSSMMLLVGVVGLAVSCWWMSIRKDAAAPLMFDLPTILQRLPRLQMGTQAAHDFWELATPWLFVLLTGGCVLRVPLPPFHPWWIAVAKSADRGTLALFLVGWLPTGCVLSLRLLLPVFATEMGQLGDRVVLWCGVAACCIACASIVIPEPRRRFAAILLTASIAAFGGMWIGSTVALHGTVLLLAGSCGVGALVLLRHESAESLLLKLISLGATFAGMWCLIQTYVAIGGSSTRWFLGALACVAWSIANWPRSLAAPTEQPAPTTSRLVPLLVVLSAICIRPQAVIDRSAQSFPDARLTEDATSESDE